MISSSFTSLKTNLPRGKFIATAFISDVSGKELPEQLVFFCIRTFPCMVEMEGIEPSSEKLYYKTSTSLVSFYYFP